MKIQNKELWQRKSDQFFWLPFSSDDQAEVSQLYLYMKTFPEFGTTHWYADLVVQKQRLQGKVCEKVHHANLQYLPLVIGLFFPAYDEKNPENIM